MAPETIPSRTLLPRGQESSGTHSGQVSAGRLWETRLAVSEWRAAPRVGNYGPGKPRTRHHSKDCYRQRHQIRATTRVCRESSPQLIAFEACRHSPGRNKPFDDASTKPSR
ncbi:hypothetical protein E2C01_008686 [Portunus trituberculatus]|uniref:Uncharacterized protein n=1 Tax=Portunus trituberculatus TaxID=210409 RepID=A0A5B7D5K5_PORTR|nr:hypothetical protein [Portunus trituberculatus]